MVQGQNGRDHRAASGLERGIALAMAEAGCHLVIADVDAEGLNRVRDEIERMGRECLVRRVDVSNRQDLEDLTEDSLAWRGDVNLLVNNAGVAVGGELDLIPLVDLDWIVGVNLMG